MKSFHSYSSSFLFSKLFTRRFGYTEAREGVKENDNQLVVDVLVREVLTNMPARVADRTTGSSSRWACSR